MTTRRAHYSSSVPDHSGKLISQVADDAALTHVPTRRDSKRRSPSRRRARPALPPPPEQHQNMENENV
jgi:hypothetical protein